MRVIGLSVSEYKFPGFSCYTHLGKCKVCDNCDACTIIMSRVCCTKLLDFKVLLLKNCTKYQTAARVINLLLVHYAACEDKDSTAS